MHYSRVPEPPPPTPCTYTRILFLKKTIKKHPWFSSLVCILSNLRDLRLQQTGLLNSEASGKRSWSFTSSSHPTPYTTGMGHFFFFFTTCVSRCWVHTISPDMAFILESFIEYLKVPWQGQNLTCLSSLQLLLLNRSHLTHNLEKKRRQGNIFYMLTAAKFLCVPVSVFVCVCVTGRLQQFVLTLCWVLSVSTESVQF